MRTIARWLVGLLLVSGGMITTGCAPDEVGQPLDNPSFRGDAGDDTDTGSEAPTSGLSECSLLNASSCGPQQACVPRSSGRRVCVDHATLELGAACEGATGVCAGGTLCFSEGGASACVEVCTLRSSTCSNGTCVAWLDIDGERVGRCVKE